MFRSATQSRQDCVPEEEVQFVCQYLQNGFPGDNLKLSSYLRQYHALASELFEQDGLIPYNNRIVIPAGMQRDAFCFASTKVTSGWTNAKLSHALQYSGQASIKTLKTLSVDAGRVTCSAIARLLNH